MKHTKRNILFHELIGLKVKVVEATVDSLVGLEGLVVDETANTLTLRVNRKLKKILKKDITLLVKLPDGRSVKVRGKLIVGRPEDRLKRIVKPWRWRMVG